MAGRTLRGPSAGLLSGLLAVGLGACGTAPRLQPTSRLDAEYLSGGLGSRPPAVTATSAYREVLARGLGSRCQMFPTDSQAFDQRARRCGATAAAVVGIARLYLEVAGDPRILPALLADGRIRWVDLPGRGCGP
jgi:hypothetical protein